ncbi:MAG TPA: endolytic transglycosylase MltG [Symbiobacteriaceae bacterium]
MARYLEGKAVRRWVPLVLLLAVVMGFPFYVMLNLRPYRPGATETVTVHVAAGASMSDVADLLYRHHLIRNPVFFRYYARLLHLDSRLQPGEYALSQGMSPAQILRMLTEGQVVVHRVTIPEGMTVREIADLLDAQGVVSRDEFLAAAAAASHLVDEYLPADVELEQPLEGYLFPATYEYRTGVTAEELLSMMVERFRQVWTPELLQRADELKMSIHEVVTLASIIEEEAQVADERARISGVYHNRLRVGMKLDADPTVAYAVGKLPGEELTLEDLAVDSPYNTYRYAGLPPGPIACPGEASILAALYPEEHDYWYFVARGDGSGRHFFARTLEEQERNIETYQANLAARREAEESGE